MKIVWNYTAVFILLTNMVMSQQGSQFNLGLNTGPEIGRIEYSVIPSLGDTQLEKQSIVFNFGKRLNRAFLGLGLGYSKYDLAFKNADEDYQFSAFEDFHNINFRLFYVKPLKKRWSLNVIFSPMLSSNFEGNLSNEDVIFNSFATFNKSWIKDGFRSSLRLGIAYGTQFGVPRLLPFVSYSKQINERFGYSLGLPTGLFYNINPDNSLNFTVRPEGVFVNNSGAFGLNGMEEQRNTKLQFNALNLSLGYRLRLGNNWTSSFNIGYLPSTNMEILDQDNNTIYDFDSNESMAINVGLSFNINKKNNNENNEQER